VKPGGWHHLQPNHSHMQGKDKTLFIEINVTIMYLIWVSDGVIMMHMSGVSDVCLYIIDKHKAAHPLLINAQATTKHLPPKILRGLASWGS